MEDSHGRSGADAVLPGGLGGRGEDAAAVAKAAGVPRDAVELAWASELVDLHLESFIPPRLWGYDLLRRNAPWWGGRLFGHLDVPRALEGGLTGAMWSIATNVLAPAHRRPGLLAENVRALSETLARSGRVRVVTTAAQWARARQEGLHAALVCVQGGNALEGAEDRVGGPDLDRLVRVTLVHLSNSVYGDTSSPLRLGADRGLTPRGRQLVERLDAARVFVDLSHASEKTFWDAAAAHDRALPLIVTHTGASAVHPLWRNLDDRQIRAVADTGGVVGAIFHAAFLGRRVRDGGAVLDHLEAILRAGGEEVAALGSDYDGFILPPAELRDGATAYYRLVARMLERGWAEARIRNVLGENFLRSFRRIRP